MKNEKIKKLKNEKMTFGNNGWGNFSFIPLRNLQKICHTDNSVTLYTMSIGLLFVALENRCYKATTISLTTQFTDN